MKQTVKGNMYWKLIVAFIFIELVGNMGIFGVPDCGVRSENLLPRRNLPEVRRDVAIGQYPWVIAIYKTDDDNCTSFKQICGGTIIGRKWVVTAGHCVCRFNPAVYRIYAGFNKLSESTVPSVRIYKVSAIFTHPDFVYYNLVNDIALLRTSTPIDISGGDIYINKICLPSVDQNFENNMTAAGWVKVPTDEQDKKLQKARVTVIKNSICNEEYDANPNDDIDFIDENVICATRQTREDCFADSGGPLMIRNELGVYTFVGVISYGYNCMLRQSRPRFILPGVYTKVSNYVTWMRAIMEQPEDIKPTFNPPIYYCFNIDKKKCPRRNE